MKRKQVKEHPADRNRDPETGVTPRSDETDSPEPRVAHAQRLAQGVSLTRRSELGSPLRGWAGKLGPGREGDRTEGVEDHRGKSFEGRGLQTAVDEATAFGERHALPPEYWLG